MVAAVPYVKPDVQTKAATLMFRAVPQVRPHTRPDRRAAGAAC